LLIFFDNGYYGYFAWAAARGETMARHREDLGRRRHVRVDLYKPGFLIPAPDAPWIECQILDICDKGVCLDVGSLAAPELFGVAFTAGGEVIRVCSLVWRRGN
jgi:hypothetical protein